MITVSDEWKNLHKKTLLPETYLRIQMDLFDPDVTDLVTTEKSTEIDISGYSTTQAAFSNSQAIVNNDTPPTNERYAILEHNLWVLDGASSVTDDYTAPGYVSVDDSPSALTLSLSEIRGVEVPAFTITWSNEYEEYATDFTIEAKNGDTVVASATVSDNESVVSNVQLPVSDYDSVVIKVSGWSLPEHRTRIDSVKFGNSLIFEKDQILSYTCEQSGDPVSSELTINTITFSLDNSADQWNPLNPDSLQKYLYEQQKITVFYGMRVGRAIEWIQAGVFYLSEWRAPSGMEATFTAENVFTLLVDTPFSRNAVGTATPSSFSDGATYDGVPVFANVGGHHLGESALKTLSEGTAVTILAHDAYSEIQDTRVPDGTAQYYQIKDGWVRKSEVTITSGLTVNTAVSEAMELLPVAIEGYVCGSQFDNDTIPVVVEDTMAAEFIQICANKCGYAHWQDASGIVHFEAPSKELTDYIISQDISYSYPGVELSKPIKNIDVVFHYPYTDATTVERYAVGTKGETLTIDNPYRWGEETLSGGLDGDGIITLDLEAVIDTVTQPYIEFWETRTIISGKFRADPRLELFDVVQVESKFGTLSPVMITSIRYTYSGAFHATYTGKVITESEEA